MEAAVSSSPVSREGTAATLAPRVFSSALYPMRLLGVGTCLLIGGLYLLEFGNVHGWHLFLLAVALVYPHLSRYLSQRIQARKRLEYMSVLVDAFILGSTVYVVAFSDVVMLSLLTVALANGMALGGARLMAACVVSAGLAIALPALNYGVPEPAGELVAMNVIASMFLLLYFIMFASVANRRARLLRESRRQVRQQKADIEIEKRKSDGLLWALLPDALVTEVHAGREPGPDVFPEATLLAARTVGLEAAVASHGPAAALQELNHCLKGFDEIIQRHGLEPYRVFGEYYVAASGAPGRGRAGDARSAAIEMQAFAAQRAESQRHNAGVALDFAFAIRRGHAWGGLVHARRFSFELWGGLLDETMDTVRGATAGDIAGDVS